MKKILSVIAILSLVFSVPVNPEALAADAAWTGASGGGNANWSDVDNWSTGPVPGTGNTATFDEAAGAGGSTISLGVAPGVTIGNIVFDNTSGNLDWYTIGSGGVNHETLTLDAGGAITMNGNVGSDQSFQSSIALSGDGSFVNDSGANQLNFNGSVNNNAHLLTVNSTAYVNISGVMSGAGGLTKLGTGYLSLSGTNTYAGVTTISDGRLYVSTIGNGGVAGNLGQATAAATNIVLDGGSLQYEGATASTNRGITVTAAGGGIRNYGGTLTFHTTGIIANGTLTISGGGNTTTISSPISGVGGFIKDDTGIATLSGTNTYAGITTVNDGRLQFGKQASLYNNTPASWNDTNIIVDSGATLAFNVGGTGEFTAANIDALAALGTGAGGFMDGSRLGLDTTNAAGGNFSYNTVIADTNGGLNGLGLTKLGTGTLTLTALNTYTGVTTFGGGTVSVDTIGDGGEAGNIGMASTSRWNHIFDGGTLSYTGLTASTDRDFWVLGNGGRIDVTTAGETLTIQGIEIALDGNLTLGGAGDILISSAIFSGGGLIKEGAGTLTLSGANTYNGAATISNGMLVLGAADVIPDWSALVVDSTLDMNGQSETIGSLAGAATGMVTNSVAAPVTLTAGGDGTSTTFSGVIEDGSDTMSFIKDGTGVLTFSGTNAYTGTTTISNGALSITNTGALPGWDTNGRYSVASGATLGVYNAVTDANITTMLGTTNFDDGSALGFDTTTANRTYGDVLSDTAQGALGLTKLGSNTLTLSGANTYTGATTVNAGTLQAGVATQAFGVDSAVTLADVAAAILDLNDFDTTIGSLNGGGTTGGNVDLGTATLTTGGLNTDDSYSGVISGTGGLTMVGTGTLYLTGSNTYTGATTISALSTLYLNPGVGGSSIIDDASAVTVDGTLDLIGKNETIGSLVGSGMVTSTPGWWWSDVTLTVGANNTSTTFSGVIGGGQISLVKEGTGTLALSGINTYAGETTVNAGTLTLTGTDGATPFSSGVTISEGAIFMIDNTAAANNADRLNDAGTVTMNGGTFNFSNDAGAADYSEITGVLTIGAGANAISVSQAADFQTATLTFDSLVRTGGTIDFSGTGLGVNNRNRILFAAAPTLGGWATYNGSGFAAYDVGNGIVEATYDADIAHCNSTLVDGSGNVRINSQGVPPPTTIALGANTTTISTLLQNWTSAATVDTAGKTLRADSIMIGSGMAALTIGAVAGDGTLTAAVDGGDLTLINNSNNNLTINAVVADNNNPSSLIKSGTGTALLASANTYTGLTTINAGILKLLATNQTLNGINFGGDAELELASGIDVAGDIATLIHGQGTLTLMGDSVINGNIGDGTPLSLGAVNLSGGAGTAVEINGDVYTHSLTVGSGSLNMTSGGSLYDLTALTNSGAIHIETGANAINMISGDDTLENQAGGTITLTAGGNGIDMGDGNNTLTNDHIIEIITADRAIFMGSDADSLTNNGTIEMGTVRQGISLSDGADTMTNNGTISVNSITDWVFIDGGGGNDTLTNFGSITVDHSAYGGITMQNGDDTLDNRAGATITITEVDRAAGMGLGQGNDALINAGMIDIGTIDTNNGINTGKGNDEITNSGTIHVGYAGRGTDSAEGGAGIAFGRADDGQAQSGNNTLTNSGTITIDDAEIAGIQMFGGIDILTNTGTITVTSTGTGVAIDMGAGNDTLTLSGGLITPDDVEGGDGTDTLNLEGWGSHTFNGAFLNFEVLNKNGTGSWTLGGDFDIIGGEAHINSGTLTLNGTITTGGAATIASGGALILNGSLDSDGLTVDAGGVLGGNGTVVSGVTNNGMVAPGGSNVLTVGNYEQTAGSTLGINVNGITGSSLAVVNLTTVDAGSAIHVTVGGYVANGTTYKIIDVGGGAVTVPGTVTSSSYALSFTAAGTADLILSVARDTNAYATASSNSNTAAVGAVFDTIAAGGNPTGDMLTVLNLLDQMGSAEEVSDALETMEPDVSSGAADASRALTAQGFTTVSNRLGGARSGFADSGVSSGEMLNGVGVWMQGLGSHLRQDMRKGIEGYRANLFGTTIGVDKMIDNHFRAGLAGSYGWARVNSKTPGSPSDDINSFQGTVYGSYDSLDLCKARQGGKKSYEAVRNQGEDFWYVDGMASFTQNNYDSRREIWLGALKRVAKAEHDAQQYSSKMEFGYTMTFEETKALEVTPFTSIGYNYLYMNKYKEEGANALNLNVDGEGFHQLEQGLGAKFAYPIVAKNTGTFIPSIKGAWLYDYLGDRFETTSSFAGGGPSFNTRGAKPAKSGLLLGAELAFLNKGNLTLTGNWDMEFKDEFMSNTYYGTVRYDF